ncbi:oxalate:formate antiporter-like [Patiria miniata]|uniref:Major facilitator superfamily (MFS) profile domain-containing protein n=1 Tax=Patiria miniata TaxID=46514 RepID=A0A914BB34_PATMI|nr:oxalate:formate antiporter-like [Patiria miniata]
MGACSAHLQWRAWAALLGGVLVHITLGTIYTFGNMSPYFTSYIREFSQPHDLRYQEASLIFALMLVGQGSSMWIGGFLERKIGVRIAVLIGGWTMSLGVLLSYFTIEHSFTLMTLTYGVLQGIGIGIAYAPPLVCAMRWLPKRKGLVNGLVVAGFGGGAFFFDQIQTAFINPNNLVANVSLPQRPDEKYFQEHSLLQRVPTSFLLCGGCYAVLQLIGCLLMFDQPDTNVKNKFQSDDKKSLINKQTKNVASANAAPDENEYGTCSSSDEGSDHHPGPIATHQEIDEKSSGLDLHPKEIVKTRAFWTLWATFLLNGQTIVFISTLYKAYGLSFISDDRLLAYVGSVSAIFNASGRLFWGHIADVYSYKVAMTSLCCCMSALMLSFIATPAGGEAMFFVWICFIFFTFSGSFSLFPTATARSFGTSYVGLNYGLLFTSQALTGPVGVLLSTTLSDTVGWFGMFAMMAGFSFIGAILTVTFNVKKLNGSAL